ncbi:hypothetical protein K474DRAFT_1669508 [Panus rudis PR-1116 ss-1]|nr:hypothetical protein K474DRAFT_1669508 [Panus rudis PR-1116 ss-1]
MRAGAANASTASGVCFRCGNVGHLPSSCQSTTTVTGRQPFRVAGSTPNSLEAPDVEAALIWAHPAYLRVRLVLTT